MTEESLAAALARLERAIARVELNYTGLIHRQYDIVGAHSKLEERHTALRDRIQETIARLDQMIEGAG